MDRDDRTVSEVIRKSRRQADLTQTDVARRVGVDVSTISKYERGETRMSPERLRQVMDAIDALPLPSPDVELLHDVAQDQDVLECELGILLDGIKAAGDRALSVRETITDTEGSVCDT